jgi:hypothetical protein
VSREVKEKSVIWLHLLAYPREGLHDVLFGSFLIQEARDSDVFIAFVQLDKLFNFLYIIDAAF